MPTIAEHIRQLLEAKTAALVSRNHQALDELIDAEFTYLNAGGRLFDKPGYIEAYCLSGDLCFVEQRISDLAVKPLDGLAIATMSLADTFRIDGHDVGGRFKSLAVFRLWSGRWRWLAGQTMQAPDR
ncbi:MAG: nuclear transport factor 2 family protein [Proteobacteria bacterium]|nr:nuclear transport factor 2 family protein [Pseudomonadota bacterium]